MGNFIGAAQQRQICACRLVVRHVTNELTPYQRRADSLPLLGIYYAQQVACVRLPRIQPQRGKRLALGIRKQSAPLIGKCEIEV